MRFYVPEWEDHVDGSYDFAHDEHSNLSPADRDLAYIWDIFDRETTPIDGVLISREQVEDSPTKFERLTTNGIYDDPRLDMPEWLPTISDCGAWGYKSLPFPPYGNEEMLDFYEQLGVDVGVTIDHLVLGSGHTSRVYLDKRAFSKEFGPSDIPDILTENVDVMVDTWPDEWPEYVGNYDSTIYHGSNVRSFDQELFEGPLQDVLVRLKDDPRAVYREDDMAFRYELTLNNAAEMREAYDRDDYSFRLMVAIQGWDPESYEDAAETVLKQGYQYLGIGGVAGSQEEGVKRVVSAVGNRVKQFERTYRTRIDTHVFGFAKTGAFRTVGRSGMTSFDSASMLRAAWTGGDNYHLDSDRRYDALRVRYPSHSASLEVAIQQALRAQEMLVALRAFDDGDSIAATLRAWQETATKALSNLRPYLLEHRHHAAYDEPTLRPIETAFRDHYEYGRELKASFSGSLRTRIVKLLREDDPEDPLPFEKYEELIALAEDVIDGRSPSCIEAIERRENESGEVGTFDQVWVLVADYVEEIEDEGKVSDFLTEYERLLRAEPWRECNCPVCTEHGIEVAIFRGNNRNRRRGFHNTRRFYDQFERDLPKSLVVTKGSARLSNASDVEEYLKEQHSTFWTHMHDVPVAELGVVTGAGVHEWWDDPPSAISFAPSRLESNLVETCQRYQHLYVDGSSWEFSTELREAVEATGCEVHIIDDSSTLRESLLDQLGYGESFVPRYHPQTGLSEY
ncbi:queuine tRNA-ribosyltransferase tRNA-guanine transglycosylase [Halalkalicoccus salilacus]|uniref:queuine tRNA-ribosyltransferase tRNA-guanine transglycosylase n=1 Tax=Halalkalicoccus salilacus TaxID=3117459 RepID=UPI00300E9571